MYIKCVFSVHVETTNYYREISRPQKPPKLSGNCRECGSSTRTCLRSLSKSLPSQCSWSGALNEFSQCVFGRVLGYESALWEPAGPFTPGPQERRSSLVRAHNLTALAANRSRSKQSGGRPSEICERCWSCMVFSGTSGSLVGSCGGLERCGGLCGKRLVWDFLTRKPHPS